MEEGKRRKEAKFAVVNGGNGTARLGGGHWRRKERLGIGDKGALLLLLKLGLLGIVTFLFWH